MKNYTSVLLRNEINILVVIKSSIGNISRVASDTLYVGRMVSALEPGSRGLGFRPARCYY